MLQPSILPTSVSAEFTESFQQTLSAGQQTLAVGRIRTIRALGIGLSLPNDLRSFLLFLLMLTVVGVGITMQIMLSIQIWQTTAKVEDLKIEYQTIEQQNTAIVWEIAQKSTLETVHQRAEALGYNVALNRYYVPAPQLVHRAIATAPLATLSANSPADQQPSTVALAVDGSALTETPAFDFTHNLQKAVTAIQQWWQKQ